MRGDDDSVDDMMPWWLGDYWRDTGDLDCREHGAYMQLLGRLWSAKGYLVFDPPRLAKLISLRPDEWETVWSTIQRFFTVVEGRLSQKRALLERERAIELKLQKHEAGLAGANARWSKKHPTSRKGKRVVTDSIALRSECPPSGSPSPSGTKEEKKGPREAARPPNLFDKTVASFIETWRSKYHEPYTPTPADRSQLGRLLQPLSPEEASALPALFEAYLRDDDAFVAEKKRHSLAWFCSDGGLNKYRTKPPAAARLRAGSAHEREAGNVAAAQRLLARSGSGGGNGRV